MHHNSSRHGRSGAGRASRTSEREREPIRETHRAETRDERRGTRDTHRRSEIRDRREDDYSPPPSPSPSPSPSRGYGHGESKRGGRGDKDGRSGRGDKDGRGEERGRSDREGGGEADERVRDERTQARRTPLRVNERKMSSQTNESARGGNEYRREEAENSRASRKDFQHTTTLRPVRRQRARREGGDGGNSWTDALAQARREQGLRGFQVIRIGSALHTRAREILDANRPHAGKRSSVGGRETNRSYSPASPSRSVGRTSSRSTENAEKFRSGSSSNDQEWSRAPSSGGRENQEWVPPRGQENQERSHTPIIGRREGQEWASSGGNEAQQSRAWYDEETKFRPREIDYEPRRGGERATNYDGGSDMDYENEMPTLNRVSHIPRSYNRGEKELPVAAPRYGGVLELDPKRAGADQICSLRRNDRN